MINYCWNTRLLTILGSAVLGLIPSFVVDAANPESVTVDMDFLDPVTITENNPLQFGLLDVAMGNNEKITIAPDSSVTDTKDNILGGTQAAASLTVTATASQSISIVVDNVSTANGYSLGNWECNYNNAASDTACDGSGYSETSVASATLLIGATLTANGNATVGVDNSSFDVTVSYQ
ncbi:MAG: DUF4402 domain-containing protein [Woeseiaceae bacterium]|nr:DUF4402 domain-containing protein [Woeseiaceae bacterium]